MSHFPLEILPFDICDRLLVYLPDFLSLKYAVLSSKRLYDTYSSRRRSILRSVEFNEVGPALPFAAALVRAMRISGQEPLQVLLEGLNNTDPDSTYWSTDMSAAETGVLPGISAAVRRLESYFCILYKDRAAPVSVLSEIESLRFHRAIYRIWIVSVLANDKHNLSKPYGLDTAFLKTMTEEELVEMHEAIMFLDVLYRNLMHKHVRFQGHFQRNSRPLELPPDDLLAAFDGNVNTQTFGISLNRSGSAIVNGTFQLFKDRDVAQSFQQKYDYQSILTSSRVETIQGCQRCGAQVRDLFGENNWHLLHSTLFLDGIMSCLPGKLNENAYVKIDASAIFERRSSFASMLNEMFDSQNDPDSGWVKSDWLCENCIKNFLRERLFSWLVSEIVKDGRQLNENCWYGWNCRTQTHRFEHAKKLNHLCEPTGRDDTGKANTWGIIEEAESTDGFEDGGLEDDNSDDED